MPHRYTSTLRRALTRRGVIAAVSLGVIVLLARTSQAAPRVNLVGQPGASSLLPGSLWQRTEFFDGHTGTCGETALAMAESWGLQRYVSPAAIYRRMADAGLMDNLNGDSTNGQLAQEAVNDGFRIDVLPYNQNNFPLDNDTWRTFVNMHIGHEAIVLQLHNGQELVNQLTGQGENAYHLQNHVITLVGFHQNGYSPLAGENLPSGWWAADGDALGEDHHLQFFADPVLAAAQPFAAIALYAQVAMPQGSALPTQPPPAPPSKTPTPASTPKPGTPTTPSTPSNKSQPPAATATPASAPAAFTPPSTTSTAATPESPFTANLTGYDISWPQCGTANPPPDSLAVIGVTGGMADVESADPTRHAADHNACLQAQWQWAEANSLAPMVYVNTANPPVNQTAEQAYAYGFTTAANAYKYATQEGVMSAMWWLDVETGNSWSATDTAANYASLRGTYDFLTQQGLTVGVYSTAYQWRVIAGANTLPGAPLWLAGASSASDATAACTDLSQRFAGGVPWLVQYPRPPYDGDITCGPVH